MSHWILKHAPFECEPIKIKLAFKSLNCSRVCNNKHIRTQQHDIYPPPKKKKRLKCWMYELKCVYVENVCAWTKTSYLLFLKYARNCGGIYLYKRLNTACAYIQYFTDIKLWLRNTRASINIREKYTIERMMIQIKA